MLPRLTYSIRLPGCIPLASRAGAALLFGAACAAAQQASDAPPPAAVDSFRLHKFAQPIGWETARSERAGDSVITRVDFSFTDRGGEVPLTALLVTDATGAPRHFVVKGRVSRFSSIDQAVDVVSGDAGRVRVRHDTVVRSATVLGPAFTIAGYAPVALQQALVRYWLLHGQPDSIATLPSGWVRVH